MLRISIVIPNLNSGPVLERAIQSILRQEYANLDLILADGGSNDESLEIARRYSAHFSHVISEPDEGQADGLNNAFRLADGDIRGWLCADDELLPGALESIAAAFGEHPDASVVAGACERVYQDGSRAVVFPREDVWQTIGAQNGLDQPAVFWRSEWHRRAGELDPTFRLAFDWEFWCRLRRAGACLAILPKPVARYHFTAHNQTSRGATLHVTEGYRVIRAYGPFGGRLADVYRFIYEHFDLRGCLDTPPGATPVRMTAYRALNTALALFAGRKWIDLYPWHFASLQERGLDWWRPQARPWTASTVPDPSAGPLPDWTGGVIGSAADANLPASLDSLDLVLNRPRLARFLDEFGADALTRDLLIIDSILAVHGLPFEQRLAYRTFRLWEAAWLGRALELARGGRRILDFRSHTPHLAIYAALAGNEVIRLEPPPVAGSLEPEPSLAFACGNLRATTKGIETISGLAPFDCVFSSSAVEQTLVAEQKKTVRQLGTVLNESGLLGLTFAYGPPASAGIHLRAPHQPPASAAEVIERYVPDGLRRCVGTTLEEPIPGALFRAAHVPFSIAALFLAKGEAHVPVVPRPLPGPSVTGAITDPAFAARISEAAQARVADWGRDQVQLAVLANQASDFHQAARERLALIEKLSAELAGLRSVLASRTETIHDLTQTLARRDREIRSRRKRR